MRTGFDAIIIGAGPAGSSAAILLALAGWSVALIEKQDFPRRKVCGECITASNLPLLAALGIGAAFEAHAGPALRRLALMRGERLIVADLPPAAHEKYRWGRALGRELLDTLLLERARSLGVHVLQPWSAQSIEGKAGDWRCAVRATDRHTGLTLRAPVAIAAYGSWEAPPAGSPSRRPMHGAADLFAFKANFRGAALDEDLLPILSFDGGYGGMVMAGGGAATVACCIRRDRLDACRRAAPGRSAGDAVKALLMRDCGGARIALEGASRDGSWLAAGPLDPGVRLRTGDGPFCIGNAAGEAHPIIGEGISMALQSAWLLCAHLLDDARRERMPDDLWQRDVGRRYAAQWRRHFAPRLRLAAVFANAAMRPASAALLLALGRAWPGFLTLGASWGGKAHCAIGPAAIAALAAHPMPARPPAEAARQDQA